MTGGGTIIKNKGNGQQNKFGPMETRMPLKDLTNTIGLERKREKTIEVGLLQICKIPP